jgi:hypothetical protein
VRDNKASLSQVSARHESDRPLPPQASLTAQCRIHVIPRGLPARDLPHSQTHASHPAATRLCEDGLLGEGRTVEKGRHGRVKQDCPACSERFGLLTCEAVVSELCSVRGRRLNGHGDGWPQTTSLRRYMTAERSSSSRWYRDGRALQGYIRHPPYLKRTSSLPTVMTKALSQSNRSESLAPSGNYREHTLASLSLNDFATHHLEAKRCWVRIHRTARRAVN